jgi:hypothetical protein
LNLPGSDGLGDACDPDIDGDGYTNVQETAIGQNPLVYCPIMRADVDSDGVVTILDLSSIAHWYQRSIPPAPERLNQDADNVISILDLSRAAQYYHRPVTDCSSIGTATPTPTGTRTPTATPTSTTRVHSNGLGQTYLNSAPLGTPGNPSTYTLSMANGAATAWPPSGTIFTGTCSGAGAVLKLTATSAAVWVYTGTLAGHVRLNSANNTAFCPNGSSPVWN